MERRSFNREILRLAIPSILANLTVPLVGLADIAISGHLGEIAGREGFAAASLIGGITIGSMLFDLLYWSFSFLRTGTGGLTAQSYGRSVASGDFREAGRILLRALSMALAAAFLIIVLQGVFLKVAFLAVDCSDEVRELSSRYFHIRVWAAPATLSLFALKGWFIGMQDTVTPMLSDLIVNVLNVGASFFLAFGTGGNDNLGTGGFKGLGYDGVALGTVVAQWTGLLFVVAVLVFRYRKKVLPAFGREDVAAAFRDRSSFGGFFSLSRDLFLRSLGLIAVYIGFTTISARFGDTLLSVSAIMMKFLLIFSYFTDGFAYAGEAMTGKYIGLGDREGLSGTIKGTFAWSMGIAFLFIGIYAFAGEPLLRLMTSDESLVAAAVPYLPWLLVMPLIGCPAFNWDGIYIGATAARPIRNASLLSAALFFATWFAGLALLPHLLPSAALTATDGTTATALITTASSTLPDTVPTITLTDSTALPDAAHAVTLTDDATLPDTVPIVTATLTDGTAALTDSASTLPPTLLLHLLLAAYFVHLAVRTVYQTAARKPWLRSDGLNARGA